MKAGAATTSAEEQGLHRIYLIDDHPMMREGMSKLIDGERGLHFCGGAGSAEQAVSEFVSCRPHLIITDITLPGRGGLDLIKDIKAIDPAMLVLVFSMHDENLYAERALRAGAHGYLMKEAGSGKMLEAIHEVLKGGISVSPKIASKILHHFSGQTPRGSHSPVEKLSDREFEVYQLIGQGKATKEIADQLHLSHKTVAVHRANIKEKLGISGVTELVHHAVRWVETGGNGPSAST
jgi:DNA-binding NarL/FixJ family response regulator